MNVLVVYCHPAKKSFTRQILESLVDGLKSASHAVEISDLYATGFRSDMSEAEYDRETGVASEAALAEDVVREQEKIEQSECVIFVYPLWWSDCPAKLKGWFDRVFCRGYAHGYDADGNRQIRMKKQKLGLLICTAGYSKESLEEIGIAESMRKVMIDDRLGQRFEKKELIILGGTIEIDKVREQHIGTVREVGKNIEKLLDA